jgi:hypothetical protein
MTRLVFIASLLAFSTAVAVNHASAGACDDTASQCLGGCASLPASTSWTDDRGKKRPGPPPQSAYADCMSRCDKARDACRGRVRPDDLFDRRR